MIVLDNADEANFLFEAPPVPGRTATRRHRLAYLPFCSHGKILVTTRSRTIASRIADSINIVELKPDATHAKALLQRKLELEVKDDAVATLANALEHMPLAVAQAAAYINRKAPRCSIQAYMNKLEKSEKSRTSLLNTTSKELRRDLEAKDSILLTWQISFEHILVTWPSAADMLSLMSFFNHQGIPEFLLKARGRQQRYAASSNLDSDEYTDTSDNGVNGSNQETSDGSSTDSGDQAFEGDLERLRDYCFVTVSPDGSTFEMHRLVQLATQVWLKRRGEFRPWEVVSLQTLDTAYPAAKHEFWEQCRVLHPHAKLLLQSEVKDRDALLNLASILHKDAWFSWEQGTYEEAEVVIRRSVGILDHILGEKHKRTFTAMDMLGKVLRYQGKYKAAEAVSEETLRGRQVALGRDDPDTLTSVSELASVLQYQGKYEEAEEMNRRALEGYEKVLGREHPFTLTSVDNLASVLRYQGKYEEAEEMNRRALEGREKVLETR